MSNPLVPPAVAAGPPVPPHPGDKWSGFTWFWAQWVAQFFIGEALALHLDKEKQDHVKRTLSSNGRRAFAYDSITGRPLDVRFGRLRRTAFICLAAWFPQHIQQLGRTQGHSV